ncbi:MAG: ACP S-malonyltransferase [Calditrichota bacterium]
MSDYNETLKYFMQRKYIFVFPGQASQYVGMGRELYDRSPAARSLMDRICGLENLQHLRDLAFSGPDELLTRTDNVQPAITAVSLMAVEAFRERLADQAPHLQPFACLGHSLGEYAAHWAAGNLSTEMVMRLVYYRGFWMNEASQPPHPPGGMVAIMGLTLEILADIAEKVGRDDCAIANLNSPGQVILSGEKSSVERAALLAKQTGAKRTVMLNVSGGWHSPLMKPAQTRMEELLKTELTPDKITLNPHIAVIANASAGPVTDLAEMRDTLTRQITSPVRWEAGVRKVIRMMGFPTLPSDLSDEEYEKWEPHPIFIELGPGKVLKGLLQNIDRKFTIRNVDAWEDLEETAAQIGN